MQGGQGPGRGVYVLRRIVAVLVVLLLLVLAGFWAWQNLFRPGGGEEQGSQPPEIAEVSSTQGGEETAAEEGSASGTQEIAVSEEGPSERSESSVRASTEGGPIGSSGAGGLSAATIPPVPTPQAVLAPPAAPSSGITPTATQIPPAVPVPSSTAPAANVVPPTTNQPQEEVVQPVPFEEAVGFAEEEVPFGEEAAFEGEESVSGGATATAGGAVAIAGSGAAAGSGALATVG